MKQDFNFTLSQSCDLQPMALSCMRSLSSVKTAYNSPQVRFSRDCLGLDRGDQSYSLGRQTSKDC